MRKHAGGSDVDILLKSCCFRGLKMFFTADSGVRGHRAALWWRAKLQPFRLGRSWRGWRVASPVCAGLHPHSWNSRSWHPWTTGPRSGWRGRTGSLGHPGGRGPSPPSRRTARSQRTSSLRLGGHPLETRRWRWCPKPLRRHTQWGHKNTPGGEGASTPHTRGWTTYPLHLIKFLLYSPE